LAFMAGAAALLGARVGSSHQCWSLSRWTGAHPLSHGLEY
jgi:hypothetical protein